MPHGTLLHNPTDAALTPYVIQAAFPDASSKVSELLLAMRSSEGIDGNKRLADLVNETSWANLAASARGWTVALENNTTSVSDTANGGIGNSAQTDGSSANVGILLRRVRITRTTKLDSLRGWEYVWLRLRTAAASEWRLEFRFSRSLVDPASVTRLAVPHDTTNAAAFGYSEIALGFFDLPEDPTVTLAGVALEVWAQRLSGTGNLFLNLTRHLPATPGKDLLTRIVVPGGAADTWLGRELVTPTNPGGLTAGTISGDALILDAANDAGGTPPNTGLGWPAGRHRVTFDLSGVGASDTARVRVRNITDSNDAVTKDVSGVAGGATISEPLEFDSVAGKSYQPQVVAQAIGGAYPGFQVTTIQHRFTPAILQNEQMRGDPLRWTVEKLEADGDVLGDLKPEGPVPFWAPAGLFALFGVPLDIPKGGYTEPESVKARTLTLSGKGATRRVL